MPKPRARLIDIAGATGFSVNTVSLALRGSPRIPEATAAAILSAAERLDYVPNRVARSLVNRSSATIGLILTDITNPTLTVTAREIERGLAGRGYSMMLAASDNDVAREKKAIETMRSHQVDGLLIYPAHHREVGHIRKLREGGYPVILLGAERADGLDIVAVDDRRGAFTAVGHLIALGHRRIAFLDASGPLGNREKLEGYRQALRASGVRLDAALVHDPGGHGARAGYGAMERVMSARSRPTALFTPTDDMAIGVLAWCRDHGLDVPGGLAVIGYDDIDAAAFASVRLSTMHYDSVKISALAVERLFEILGTPASPTRATLIEPALVVRASCGGIGAPA